MEILEYDLRRSDIMLQPNFLLIVNLKIDFAVFLIFRGDFQNYAEVCFENFGDRVKYWITLNEPWSYSNNGYAEGTFAPGRCSNWQDPTCLGGDSGTEPYIVAHNQLLAHAAAVDVYKKKFQVF